MHGYRYIQQHGLMQCTCMQDENIGSSAEEVWLSINVQDISLMVTLRVME